MKSCYAICQLESNCLVTKHTGEISFESPATQGDIVEFGLATKAAKPQLPLLFGAQQSDQENDLPR